MYILLQFFFKDLEVVTIFQKSSTITQNNLTQKRAISTTIINNMFSQYVRRFHIATIIQYIYD